MYGWSSSVNVLNASSHSVLYNQPCAIIITDTPLVHLDTRAIKYKADNRKKFNQAGNLMVQRYRTVYPNWNQFGRAFAMLDPSDATRDRLKAVNEDGLYTDIENSRYWQYLYKLPEMYVKGKRICSEYVNEHI